MIAVDGVEFNPDLTLNGEFGGAVVSGRVMQTMGVGSCSVVQRYRGKYSRMLVLEAQKLDNGFLGWFTLLQLEGLRLLEASGKTVEVVVEERSFFAKVAPGGIDVVPHRPRPNVAATDMYVGTVAFNEIV